MKCARRMSGKVTREHDAAVCRGGDFSDIGLANLNYDS